MATSSVDGCPNAVQTTCQDGPRFDSSTHAHRRIIAHDITQGGSSGDVIVGQFAMLYHNEAAALGVDLSTIYAAQLADAENEPDNWDIQGRQASVYKSVTVFPSFNACI
jgi:hypothetical protein